MAKIVWQSPNGIWTIRDVERSGIGTVMWNDGIVAMTTIVKKRAEGPYYYPAFLDYKGRVRTARYDPKEAIPKYVLEKQTRLMREEAWMDIKR